MKIKLAVTGFLSAIALWAADPAPVPLTFNAILTVGKEQRFGVSTDGGARSGWVAVGGTFEGYKLSEFDQRAQVLVFTRDGQTFRVPIAAGNVDTLEASATLSQATDVLNQMKFEEMLGKMIEQQRASLVSASKQMMGSMAGQVSSDDFAAFQTKVLDAIWSEMKPEELKSEMARVYAEIFSKDELRGMSAFYSTPAGQAMIDKQPEMQERMMAIMMPRMMRAMPRIQQMSQEFATEQSTKRNPPVPTPVTK